MTIEAIFDRVEDGSAILFSKEAGMEIVIPYTFVKKFVQMNQKIILQIGNDGNINILRVELEDSTKLKKEGCCLEAV